MSWGQAEDEIGSRMLLPLLLPAPLNPEDPGEARSVGHGQEIGCDNEPAHLGRPSWPCSMVCTVRRPRSGCPLIWAGIRTLLRPDHPGGSCDRTVCRVGKSGSCASRRGWARQGAAAKPDQSAARSAQHRDSRPGAAQSVLKSHAPICPRTYLFLGQRC